MISAIVGAGVVALGTGMALPDTHTDGTYSLDASADGSDQLGLRNAANSRAGRDDDREMSPVSTLNQPAPDIWVLPIRQYTVTSFFGERWGRLHPGVDLGAPLGTPFFAAAAGKVILARWNGGYGYNVMIDHGGGTISVYGHSSKLLVKEGQMVKAGEKIALVGNTGHSFGTHLHYEIRVNDKPIEPLDFMKKHGVDIQKHTESV